MFVRSTSPRASLLATLGPRRPHRPRLRLLGADAATGSVVAGRGRRAGVLDRLHVRTGAARVLGSLGLAALVATGLVLAVNASAGPSARIVPASRRAYPDWVAGPLGNLAGQPTSLRFYVLFMAMCACYLVVLACAASVPARLGVAAIVALHLIFLLSAPLLSRDVFNYIIYAREGVVHGLNPYLHGAGAAPFDPAFPHICCRHSLSPYGPLFTLFGYAIVWTGAAAMLWIYKSAIALAGLACVALVWACARRRELDPLPAALFVGLNPVWLVFTIGGGHNDLLMMGFALGGIALWLGRREALGAATVVAGLAVKVSAGILLPFMILGSERRWRVALAAAGASLAVLALFLIAFGTGAPRGFLGAIGAQQGGFFQRSVPQQLGLLFGLGPKPVEVRLVLNVLFVATLVWLLWRTWRGADWIVAAGWATLALLATSTWLLPWYVVWVLPLAALGHSRGLRIGALLACAYVIWARTPLILG